MDAPGQLKSRRLTRWRVAALLVPALLPLSVAAPGRLPAAAAADGTTTEHVEHFDGPRPSWSARYPRSAVELKVHRRVQPSEDARAYEYVRFDVRRRGTTAHLETQLSPARVIDDLKLSLWWNSSHGGAVLSLRVVFPRHRDPRTNSPLTTLIKGDRYTTVGKWQRLTAGISERQIAGRIRELRERFNNPDISPKGMYVRAAVISVPLNSETVHTGIAEMTFGPIVPPTKAQTSPLRGASATAVPDAGSGSEAENTRLDRRSPVEFRLDRLHVRGRPFFPRITAYHGESAAVFRNSGINVVWVPRYDDASLVRSLAEEGLWLTATPPVPPETNTLASGRNESGRVHNAKRFGAATAPILFWNVGTRIPPSSRTELIDWVQHVQQADRLFDRPILGDVAGEERIFSRHISLLGLSRHVLQTDFSLKQYRDWLIQKRNLARPGSFVWTWIQTEHAASGPHKTQKSQSRQDSQNSPSAGASAAARSNVVVEPEQIRLQVYAALAAGCRGIGYWKSTALNDDSPGAEERRLILSQLNLELDLLAPWLSTGIVVDQIPFTVQDRKQNPIGQRRLDFRTSPAEQFQGDALLDARLDRQSRTNTRSRELEASVIRSEYGTLLLPVWYGTNAQFVPGKLAANNARVVVRGISQSASAWLVTTTGVRSLVRERVTGGIRITIPKFDQTAAVILTSDRRLIDALRERVQKTAPISARLGTALARAKLKRVREVNSQLEQLGLQQPDAPQLLHKAGAMVARSQSARKRGDYASAWRDSANALQLLRILQRAHFNDAVRSLASPVASPSALCFQTLPEHWRLLRQVRGRRSEQADNILRSGDFEDIDTMIAEGWKHTQHKHSAVRAVAELYPKGKQGSYSLRLVAAPIPGNDPPVYLSQPPVTVHSPPMRVRSGQMVRISGWVNVATPLVGNPEGALLYENITGPRRALRWTTTTGWQRFTLWRTVRQSGTLRLTFSLHGMGEIRFDDVQVKLYDPPAAMAQQPADDTSTESAQSRWFDRLPRLPSLPRPVLPRWGNTE